MFIKGKKSRTEDTRAQMLAKEREKRRRKMLRTKYGQTPRKHAKKGMQSFALAVIVLFLLFLMLASSFFSRGQVSTGYGALGLASVAFSGTGVYLGIKGYKERDKNYITCRLGIICNVTALAGLAAIFIRGLI